MAQGHRRVDSTITPFHLAFPVYDLDVTRRFYVEGLGCDVGREDTHWIDFNLFGHQISAHLRPKASVDAAKNAVDGDAVPIPHFGVVLTMPQWHALKNRLEAYGATFEIEPKIRFQGQPGEQATFFLRDPSNNALEFKAFAHMNRLFSSED